MPNKVEQAYNVVMDAVYIDACMCQDCKMERKKKAFQQAITMVSSLKFKPEGLEMFGDGSYYDMLAYLHHVENDNSKVRKFNQKREKPRRLYYCKFCGKLHSHAETMAINGNHYCYNCSTNYIFTCYDCGKVVGRHDSYTMNNGRKRLCADCRKKYERCNHCGTYATKDKMVAYLHGADEQGNQNYYMVCPKCDSPQTCTRCNEVSFSGLMHQINRWDMVCPSCVELERGLEQYYFKPMRLRWQRDPNEGKVSDSAFHMGFELEVGVSSSFVSLDAMVHLVKDLVGRDKIYCVQDGTIQRDAGVQGFEICTHPFTWQDYRKRGASRWDDLLIFLRNKGWIASLPALGLHIHTTKDAWGNHQIYKLLQFIYNNKSLVTTIARREPNKYCVFDDNEFDEAVLVAKDKKNRMREHYNTINLNSGDNRGRSAATIEFRMFQGTLEPLYLHSSIEFVKSCYEFTRECASMTQINYLKFIAKYRNVFTCLNEFLKMKGVI